MTVDNSTLGLVAGDGESFIFRTATSSTAHVVKTGNTTLNGIVVNSHTSGTIEIRDGVAFVGGTLKFGTIAVATGPQTINFFGARFAAGLVVSLGGTIDVTVLYK